MNLSGRKIYINNICMLENVEINISGLTVIAGENDTGKSTIGKVLFALIKACEMSRGGFFYKNRDRYIRNKIYDLKSLLSMMLTKQEYYQMAQYVNALEAKINFILRKRYKSEKEKDTNLSHIFEEMRPLFLPRVSDLMERFFDEVRKAFTENFRDKFRINNLENLFKYLFMDDYVSNFASGVAKIRLESASKITKISIEHNKIASLNDGGRFFKDVTYIDTPVIFQLIRLLMLSDLNEKEYMPTIKDLKRKLADLPRKIDLWEKDELDDVISAIKNIIKGDIVIDEPGSFVFSRQNKKFRIENIATGIKSFAIILLLLKNGWLTTNTLLVIDEPEVHLHPKWQVEYCRIISLLVRKGITVIVATHSPYIVQGLIKMTDLYEIKDRTNFYLMSNKDGVGHCENVTGKEHKIFQLLAEPFDRIF
jgi:predicted ATPase